MDSRTPDIADRPRLRPGALVSALVSVLVSVLVSREFPPTSQGAKVLRIRHAVLSSFLICCRAETHLASR